uniref:Uncharacterized protein n=1 Tax=Photinus pyralis TaxID=7054 RepID=A0A1Y1M8S9_PHOPY
MDVRWSFLCNFVLFIICLFHDTATFKQEGVCFFPERWEGTWFQSGVRQPIIIEGPRLSSKGRCIASEGDKFLVVDEKSCYRCVVIHEKHENVLQYKETYCYGKESLLTLCSSITGDALLYSMFRENAAPISCPFRGPFTFTYNRGDGECRSPVSSIDTCTEDSRLLLSYQACPDIHSSESTVEELQCLAVWKEGSSRYLVGKVHHSHATSNEDRFRCFVYEKASVASEALDGIEFRVAQSGDATCNGLFSATEGSRTMTLKRASSLSKCRFPLWLANYNHWHTLDYSVTYSFHHRNSTLRITNSSGLEMKVVCAQTRHSTRDETSVMLLTHYTMGCQSGFTCMVFYRRDTNVMEVQAGAQTKRMEDACTTPYFNRATIPYITLVTATPESRECPYVGKFAVRSLIKGGRRTRSSTHNRQVEMYHFRQNYHVDRHSKTFYGEVDHIIRTKRVDRFSDCDNEGFSNLIVGCSSADIMEFRSECPTSDFITSYSCHGGWEENGTHYLIATPISRSPHGAHRYCFIYREYDPYLLLFSSSSDNCDRSLKPGVTGDLIFNATIIGKCVDINSMSARNQFHWTMNIIPLLNLIIAVVSSYIQR